MSCSRGKASPTDITKLQLFADSAGYCQNPTCNKPLFRDYDGVKFHIAEMAHIFSASDIGPRNNVKMTAEERGAYENLILLCSDCHTEVDKVPTLYLDELIQSWKAQHLARINDVFEIAKFANRKQVRAKITGLLTENKVIFDNYGPMSDHALNPETEMVTLWTQKIHSRILPNNRMLLRIVDINRDLLTNEEIEVVELYRQHVLDFENKHLNNNNLSGSRFPEQFSKIFID